MNAPDSWRPIRAARSAILAGALLAAGFSLAACEGKSGESAAPALAQDVPATLPAGAASPSGAMPVIVCLGDSLTAGHGVPEEQSWPSRLQAKLDAEGYRYKVVNAGISGDTSAGGLARMDWLLRQRIDILIVELGANDGLRGVDPAETRRNLAAIIEKGQGAGARVVLAGMKMPINYGAEFKRDFDAVFPELAEQYRLPFIPFLLESVATRRDLNLPDGIHPTGEGYALVIDTVWKTLAPLLKRG